MKLTIEIEEKHPRTTRLPATFETVAGEKGWVKMEIDGKIYEFDRRDFVALAATFDSLGE